MKKIIMTSALILGLVGSAGAAPVTFFGEDLGLGESTALLSWTNASAAETAFLSNLTGVGTENFESFTTGTGGPLALTFAGAGTATLTGSGAIATVATGSTNSFGRYATSGSKYWETGSANFTINFTEAISAFGFYGIDIGDFNGQIELTALGGSTEILNVGNSTSISGGSVLYYGFYDLTNAYTSISFGNTGSGSDVFGFDDMTIGTLTQVTPNNPVPEPSTILLMGAGLLGLLGYRRKRSK